ncbi:MAG TPA: hypothetical protein VEK34_08010 [Methylocella sp.]|nr:hypothetical protein [Methylocella sp.]
MTISSITYCEVPALSDWLHHTSVRFAIRSKDPVLVRLDRLISQYPSILKEPFKRMTILCDLFQTTKFWLKHAEKLFRENLPVNYPRLKGLEPERAMAIRALYECVTKKLCGDWSIPPWDEQRHNKVSEKLYEYFGLALSKDGIVTDEHQQAKYIIDTDRQLYKYRLWFRNGLAYQCPWWSENPQAPGMFLAQSSRGYPQSGGMIRKPPSPGRLPPEPMFKGWSGFIMTKGRQIYMTEQDIDKKTFHSTYKVKKIIAMAGTIGIDKGRILGVRADSGHYYPGQHNMHAFLMALMMYGVGLKRLTVYDYTGHIKCPADVFYNRNINWDDYVKGQQAEMQKRSQAASYLNPHPSNNPYIKS